MIQEYLIKHSKIIAIFSIVAILVCIISIVVTFINKYLSRKTYLTLQFAPSSATLEIDNTDYSFRNGSYEMKPGHYSGVIKADNFKTKEISFEIKPHQTNTIIDYLVHATEGLKYFEKNAADISTLRQIQNDDSITSFINEYNHKASIFDILPLEDSWSGSPGTDEDHIMYYLKITNGNNNPNCLGTLCLQTAGIKDDRYRLQEFLNQKGYNINDYEVFYEFSRL